MKKFNIEEQFQLYLKLVGLNQDTMPLDQQVELKRAFVAGAAQLHVYLFRGEEIPQENFMEYLEDVEKEIANYWTAETKNTEDDPW